MLIDRYRFNIVVFITLSIMRKLNNTLFLIIFFLCGRITNKILSKQSRIEIRRDISLKVSCERKRENEDIDMNPRMVVGCRGFSSSRRASK
jgi:hypothetical protein